MVLQVCINVLADRIVSNKESEGSVLKSSLDHSLYLLVLTFSVLDQIFSVHNTSRELMTHSMS